MESGFLNSAYLKNEYKNSVYFRGYADNSILNPETSSASVPSGLDLSDNVAVYDYSDKKLRGLFEYFNGKFLASREYDKKDLEFDIENILSKLDGGDADSSNLEMILDLISDKKLTPEILSGLNGKIGKCISDDLDKLYYAYINNIDVKDVFVPEFKNEDEAKESLQTGEVCQIAGDENISTKMPDGSIKKLFINADAYLKLFPPVERFIAFQGEIADCYLVAALNSIYQNQNTRHKILEMFRQNPDGTLDIAFYGFKYNKNGDIVQNNPDVFILKDISDKIKNAEDKGIVSYTAQWLRAVEVLFEEKNRARADIFLKQQIRKFEQLKMQAEENPSKKGETALKFHGMPITTEEINYFLDAVNSGEEMVTVGAMCNKFERLFYTEVLSKLAKLKDKHDMSSNYERLILERYKRYMKNPGRRNLCLSLEESMPKKIYLDIFDKDNAYEAYYNNLGTVDGVFSKLGLYPADAGTPSEMKEKLFSKDASKCIYTCASFRERKKGGLKIYDNHAYSLEPVDTKDGRRFIIRNPYNTLGETVISFETLKSLFDAIYVTH